MINLSKRKKAFTLAEVLITIAIIGVIAAITIPPIKNYAFEREAVSRAKQTYALLSDAVKRWQMDNDCLDESERCPEISYGTATPHNSKLISQGIAKYLPVIDAVHTPTDAVGRAIYFIPEKSYPLNGTYYSGATYVSLVMDRGQTQYAYSNFFLLKNGVVVEIVGCWNVYDIIIDINGIKKPNRNGKDQFTMSLYSDKKKTLNPFMSHGYNRATKGMRGECNNNKEATNTCNADDGKSPMAYVLMHNSLPNFAKMGYPTMP